MQLYFQIVLYWDLSCEICIFGHRLVIHLFIFIKEKGEMTYLSLYNAVDPV